MYKPSSWKHYHTIWLMLFLVWMFSYLDRAITGPIVSWMVKNNASFLEGVPMPHALGGLIGSMFFAGYMLTQFPAGYLGDKYGRKIMIGISAIWAGIATLLSGAVHSITAFIGARVLTGLGEGAYYSNDRALIAEVTPKEKKGLGMGVVFVGLAAGLTIANVLTPYLLDWLKALGANAWRAPFLMFGAVTLVLGICFVVFVKRKDPEGKSLAEIPGAYKSATLRLVLYAILFMAVVMSAYLFPLYMADKYQWSKMYLQTTQAVLILLAAFMLVVAIYWKLGKKSAEILKNRNLILMYVSAIPILYMLWFFGSWILLVISDASKTGIVNAAFYAGLFGIANAIGYPLGGKISDMLLARGISRKIQYFWICLLAMLLTFVLAIYLFKGGQDPLVLGAIMFAIGVPFAAMQTVHMTLTSDLAPPHLMGQAFGMWNLVAEIGAILSPVISGTLRDLTGNWVYAVAVAGALLAVSAGLILFVRNKIS